MKKNVRIIILIIIMIVIIIIGVISSINILEKDNKSKNKKIKNNNSTQNTTNDYNSTFMISEKECAVIQESDYILHQMQNKSYFYTVKETLERFLSAVSNDNKISTINKLNSEYVKNNNVNINNLQDVIKLDIKNPKVEVVNMLELKVKNNQILRYVVRFKYLNNQNETKYYNCIVCLDFRNVTFCVEPIDSNIEDLTTVNLDFDINSIPENEYNKYTFRVVVSK